MAGIYIHIPFCRRACHYCDFHFSTTMKKRPEMVQALIQEIRMRRNELHGETVETIYFGGGTPSVLSDEELTSIINEVYANHTVSENPEITLEVNPDDLNESRIASFAKSQINRLSIGIQSFYDDDLAIMNRAHDANEAERALQFAMAHLDNVTIDLIYGIPGASHEKWKSNIEKALSYGVPHISAYALTVEPKTALDKMIRTGSIPPPDESHSREQFEILAETLTNSGFVHYELSNFGKPGYFSRNNTAYWQGKKYLGIGPSAHSYDGQSRSWNIANNSIYIQKIKSGELPSEKEILSTADRFNELVMTGLRTMWGISLEKVQSEFGEEFRSHLLQSAERFLNDGFLEISEGSIRATSKGKFLTDGISSDLFLVD